MDSEDKARLVRVETKMDYILKDYTEVRDTVKAHEGKFKAFKWITGFLVALGTAIGTIWGQHK